MKTQMTIVNENICAVYDNKQPITVKHQEIQDMFFKIQNKFAQVTD